MDTKELAPCITVFENAFKPGNFLELLEAECQQQWGYVSWYLTYVGNPGKQQQRADYRSSLACELAPLSMDTSQISEPRLVPLAESWQRIHEDLQSVIWSYRNTYDIDVKEDEGFALLKYSKGAEYRGHVDHAPQNQRVFSIVAFVNDNFDGGELNFPIFDVSVTPKAGSAVCFPSNFPYFHYASPVGSANTNDTKYSLVTWFR
jgi:hypothetical protein